MDLEARQLSLVDISPYIYSGAYYKNNILAGSLRVNKGHWDRMEYPAGGVAFLIQSALSFQGDVVFCSDTRPTAKRDMFPTYKANRPYNDKKQGIDRERVILEYILNDCGAQMLVIDGYESDDLIYSLWKAEQDNYDIIHVFSQDSDASIMVNEKTSILPCNSKGKQVHLRNYPHSAMSKVVTPFNSVGLRKVIYGDPKDNISSPLTTRRKAHLWTQVCEDKLITQGHSPVAARMLINKYSSPDVTDALLDNVKLVWPINLDVHVEHLRLNEETLALWQVALGIVRSGNHVQQCKAQNKVDQMSEDLLDVLKEMGMEE